MKDFVFYAPTEVVFGKDSEQQTGKMAKKYGATHVLVHYGGQSAMKSGLLDIVTKSLADEGIKYTLLGGVVPNPRLSKVREGIALVKEVGADLILAVGGGSVIDSAKAIGYGVANEGDVWDFFIGLREPVACMPIATVLTIPAAGSEMSNGSVITNEEGNYKRAVDSNLSRCKFAIMNPERTFTLPAYQTACGITDMLVHIMERYFNRDPHREVTEGLAESLIRSIISAGTRLMADPNNYDLRAEIMWAGSMAHNDVVGLGAQGDWSTHELEHELSGMFDVAHGAGLAAIWGCWATYAMENDTMKFVRFAQQAMGVEAENKDDKTIATEGISRMVAFFKSIGMPTSIPELIGRPAIAEEIDHMATYCSRNKTSSIGSYRSLAYSDMLNIYTMANK